MTQLMMISRGSYIHDNLTFVKGTWFKLSITFVILGSSTIPWKASATMAWIDTRSVMCLHSFPFRTLIKTPPTTWYFTFNSLFSVCFSFFEQISHTYSRFHFCTNYGVYISALVLPVTLPVLLRDPHHQSCRSLPLHSSHTASSPYSPFHGSWTSSILLCTVWCVCVCEWWETQRYKCNLIVGHLECLASALFSLRGCGWQTGEHTWSPAVPCAHRRTHKHSHSPDCTNASQKAPELRGKSHCLSLLQGCEVLTVSTLWRQIEALSLARLQTC